MLMGTIGVECKFHGELITNIVSISVMNTDGIWKSVSLYKDRVNLETKYCYVDFVQENSIGEVLVEFPNEMDDGSHRLWITKRQILGYKEPLTYMEMECLKLFCLDKTAKEISDELCISKRTVDFHSRNFRSKLKVHSTSGAVAKAFRMGIIK